jgi:signal transduction histidine kinase
MAGGLGGLFTYLDDSLLSISYCRGFIDHIRFFDNQSGYFFVYDFNAVNIAHGTQKDLQGKNLWDYQDSRGNYVLRDMINIVKTDGSGFYDYYWDNPLSGKEEAKKAYVTKIPGCDYFIGSGVYIQ